MLLAANPLPGTVMTSPTVMAPPPSHTQTPSELEQNVYDRTFWLAYVANVALVTANALTFRFAEYVAWLGGTEEIAGIIVSVGVWGALGARLVLGQGIDRYGTRLLWSVGTLGFIASTAVFVFAHKLSWPIYAARAGFSVSIACMFTCSIVHVQNRVPVHRRTEIIGNLGSSGFVGMVIGAISGDVIFNAFAQGPARYTALFGGTVALGAFYFCVVTLITRGDEHCRPPETPAAHRLLFRYWPGNVVLVALMMGVGLTVTTVFLTRYATSRGMTNGVGAFFTVYAVSAFFIRICTRHWARVWGRHRMIVYGLIGHAIGHFSLPFVTTEWQFLFPALACGFGHALLFPAVVSLGSGSFPQQYRGSGTALVLGFVEMGTALCAPLLGRIIDTHGFKPMFWSSAGIAMGIAAVYRLTSARRPDEEQCSAMKAARAAREQQSEDSIAVPFPHVGRNP